MNNEDGSFLSLATIALGACLLIFSVVTGFLIYIKATEHDRKIRAREKENNS